MYIYRKNTDILVSVLNLPQSLRLNNVDRMIKSVDPDQTALSTMSTLSAKTSLSHVFEKTCFQRFPTR